MVRSEDDDPRLAFLGELLPEFWSCAVAKLLGLSVGGWLAGWAFETGASAGRGRDGEEEVVVGDMRR